MAPAPGSDPRIDPLLEAARRDGPQPLYVIHGDLVLAEPAARRLAEGLAETAGCGLRVERRPETLSGLLADLQTLSLFEPAKVVLATDSAVLADQRATADLLDAAADLVPVDPAGELSPRERAAASRLLQALRLHGLDPDAGDPAALLDALPDDTLKGGDAYRRKKNGRGRGKNQIRQFRDDLVTLLEAARAAELSGRDGSDLAGLQRVVSEGLPERYSLVLAESSLADSHPLVAALKKRKALVGVGGLEDDRGRVQGLDLLAAELERQTGVGIDAPALSELARRTLRQEKTKRGADAGIDADSSARLAGEYRKLAGLVPAGRRIDRKLVERAVEDRGEEDVFKLLDAVGEGRGDEALDRYHRLMASSSDPIATRLSFFSLLAEFCRQLAAIRGLAQAVRVPPGEKSYPRFKSRHAPALQGDLPTGAKSPLAGLHPYRLHRAYLAASRLPEWEAQQIPAWVLQTERRIKGDSGSPDTAVAHLLARVSGLLA